MKPTDLLLGRKTFEIFEAYWPQHENIWLGVNDVTKYVMSNTVEKSDWKNSVFLKNLADIEKARNSKGSDIQVHGSGELTQLLLKNDLVDELWLKIFPITLGMGKRLFAGGTVPATFMLTDSLVTPNGVIFANYRRAGKSGQAPLEGRELSAGSSSRILERRIFRMDIAINEEVRPTKKPMATCMQQWISWFT